VLVQIDLFGLVLPMLGPSERVGMALLKFSFFHLLFVSKCRLKLLKDLLLGQGELLLDPHKF
jgi:hypothetical protein